MDRLNERWKKQSLILIYKAIHNLLPEALCSRVELRQSRYDFHNIDTLVKLPKPRTIFLKRSPFYIAQLNYLIISRIIFGPLTT